MGECDNRKNQMKLNITIPIEQYNELKAHSKMLGQIACVVRRFARHPSTTTYECVVKLNERERNLTTKIRQLQKIQ